MNASLPNGQVAAEPDVTPMVDVLLVLLVTFLVALPLTRRTLCRRPVRSPRTEAR